MSRIFRDLASSVLPVSGPWLLSSSSDQMATSDDTKTEEENTKTTNEDMMKTKVYNKDNEMALDFVFSWRD